MSRAIAKRFLCVRVCQGPQGDACTAGSLSATSLVAGAKFAILDGIRRVQSEFPMIRPHNTFPFSKVTMEGVEALVISIIKKN